ncbi:hypothetical protein HGRIS_006902 [Hohenbuehelia grisea]|uniref:GH16 domain-containing protein n=1 Tax=Hohenbuehelia grisea TaxID=104357 RepID=A0ABR3JAI9_9AGAR
MLVTAVSRACTFVLVLHHELVRAQYTVAKDYHGQGFFTGWNFYGSWDNLTQGDVNYLTQSQAAAQRLTYVNDAGNAVIRVDNFTNVSSNEKRNSIRIESKDTYSVGSLWIIDAVHLPFGCSVWPAFWSKGDDWPNGGEIDIIEGINLLGRNQVALHTTPGCFKHDVAGTQSGQTIGSNCSVDAGCVVGETRPNSYGSGFAQAGGGVFATQLDVSGIYVWFWTRAAIPQSIRSSSNTSNLNISDWGMPSAAYPSTSCNITQLFSVQRLVLDITLCGVWAGVPGIYNSTCANTGATGLCYNDNVIGPGSPKYDNAYFEIPFIRAYTVAASPPAASAAPKLPSINPLSTSTGTESSGHVTVIITPPTARPINSASTDTLARFRAMWLQHGSLTMVISVLGSAPFFL